MQDYQQSPAVLLLGYLETVLELTGGGESKQGVNIIIYTDELGKSRGYQLNIDKILRLWTILLTRGILTVGPLMSCLE